MPAGYVDLNYSSEVRLRFMEKVAPDSRVGRFCFQVSDGDVHVTLSGTLPPPSASSPRRQCHHHHHRHLTVAVQTPTLMRRTQ